MLNVSDDSNQTKSAHTEFESRGLSSGATDWYRCPWRKDQSKRTNKSALCGAISRGNNHV